MVSSHASGPIGVEGPTEHVWSSEGVEHPAWRVLVLYAGYTQEFWFMSETAAVAYISAMGIGPDVSAPGTKGR